MEFYKETVNRFVVEAVDTKLPEEHLQAKRDAGIDPDEDWRLVWSFTNKESADRQAQEEQKQWKDLRAYRVRDIGGANTIERAVY